MSCSRALPLSSGASSDAVRVLLVSPDLHKLASYYASLETAGFEVLVAFDLNSALDICHRSIRPVQAAVVLSDRGTESLRRDGEFVRGLSDGAPALPCILVPPETGAAECAVLIRTALRCTAASYIAADRVPGRKRQA